MKFFMNLSQGVKIGLALVVAVLLAGVIFEYASGQFAFAKKETTCQRAVSKWEAENPELTEAKSLFSGVPAPVDFSEPRFAKAKEFKSQIIAAINDGPDLAGKYAVAQWGCGTSCQNHAVVNMETGKIIAFDFLSEAGISMSDHYNVLITNPRENLPAQEDFSKANTSSLAYLLNIPREYYVLLETGPTTTLSKICTENPFEGFTI